MTRQDRVRNRSAFFSLACRPRVVAQGHVLVEGHLYFCPHGALGHAFADYPVWGSGVADLGKTDKHSRASHEQVRGGSSHFSA